MGKKHNQMNVLVEGWGPHRYPLCVVLWAHRAPPYRFTHELLFRFIGFGGVVVR